MRFTLFALLAVVAFFAAGAVLIAPAQAGSLTVCNQSASRLDHVILEPRTGGTFSQTPMSVGVPSGTCLTESGMPPRTYNVFLQRIYPCRFDIDVTGDVTWTFDAALAAACDRRGEEIGEMLWGDEEE